MHPQTLTDEQLGFRLLSGDPEAPGVIYERFKTGLYRFCLRLLSDSEAAQDIVHETIVIMISRRHSLQNPSALKSWLFTIARNEAFAFLRSRRFTDPLDEEKDLLFDGSTPPEAMEHRERSEMLAALLDRLLPQYKEVLVLREFEGMNYEEIAAVTGSTVSSIKSRLFKARNALSVSLQKYRKRGDV